MTEQPECERNDCSFAAEVSERWKFCPWCGESFTATREQKCTDYAAEEAIAHYLKGWRSVEYLTDRLRAQAAGIPSLAKFHNPPGSPLPSGL